MNKILAGYKTHITSIETNQINAPFIPKGRYYGFDVLAPSLGSGGYIFAKISHNRVLEYLDEDNVVSQKAVAVTPHGVVFLSDEDHPVQIPLHTGTANQTRFDRVVMDFSWEPIEGQDMPYITLVPGAYQVSDSYVGNLYTGLLPTQVVLGIIKVPYGAVFTDCVYTPVDPPSFANNPIDSSNFAKLTENNYFEKVQSVRSQFLTSSNFSSVGNGKSRMVLAESNFLKLNIQGSAYVVSTIEDEISTTYSSLYILQIENVASFTLAPGGNVLVTTNKVFYSGDTILLLKGSNTSETWKVVSSFGYADRKLNLALYSDQHNLFQKGFKLGNTDLLISAGLIASTLNIPDSGNVSLIIDTENPSIKYFKKLVNGVVSDFEDGDSFVLTIKKGDSFKQVYLYIQPNEGDGFYVNDTCVEQGLQTVLLYPGMYFFQRTNFPSGHKWAVMATLGSIRQTTGGFINIISGASIGSSGTFSYLRYYVDSLGIYHITGRFILTSALGANTLVNFNQALPDLANERVSFICSVNNSVWHGIINGTGTGITLTLTGMSFPAGTYYLEERVLSL